MSSNRQPFMSDTATRFGLLIGVPVAVVLGIQGVSWAALQLKQWNAGDTLTAEDLNGNFAAIDQAFATGRIYCTKTVTLPAGTTGYTANFAASDCKPAVLPDASYIGSIAALSGCAGFHAWRVRQPAEGVPGVGVYINSSCANFPEYTFEALFVR